MRNILLAFILIYIYGCSTGLKNLDENKKAVIQYYESGKWNLEVSEVIEEGLEKIKNATSVTNPTVVFDVDETTLDNYKYIKSISFGYENKLWSKWMEEAKAEALLQTKYLYDYLAERDYKIVFLTARTADHYEATRKNLVEEGYTKIDTLICKSPNYDDSSSAAFKENERKKLVEKGYNIIACVGDQWSDLQGEHTGIKIKIPNYIYIVE